LGRGQSALLSVGPWTDITTFTQGVQWTVGTAFKQLGGGHSALHSNIWAVESQHHLQTVVPWTDSTTFKQDVQWTVSTTFKQLGHGQTAPPSNKVCGGQSALHSKSWDVDSQHYLQTAGRWRVSTTFKQGTRWTVSTTFKQVCRGQFLDEI